jgi:MFS family permease
MAIKTLEVAARQMLKLKKGHSAGLTLGIHYAWIIIVIAAFMHMAGGSIRQTFGVLIVPFEVQFGWSPASSVLAYSLASIVGALLAPLSGIATDRYGARKVILLGIVFYFFGAIFTGFASQVWHIWISFGLGLGVAQAAFNVPILAAATSWFRTRLGLGIGLLQASHGVGPALMVILVSLIISSVDWQLAFLTLGTLGALVMLGLMFFFRNRPSDMGLRAYGAPDAEPVRQRLDPVIERMRAKAYRVNMQGTSAFWKLAGVHFLGCVGHAIVIIYVIPIAIMAGVEFLAAAGILTTLVSVSVLTRFLTPVVADYLGAKRAMATMFLLQGLPVLMLFWTQEVWQFYLFAVIFGLGYGGEGSAFPIINRQYFGRGPMGRSFGWQQFGAGTGMAFGAWIGGALLAVFGSYSPTIILSAAASVTGAFIILSMEPTTRLLIPDWEDLLPSEARSESKSAVTTAD